MTSYHDDLTRAEKRAQNYSELGYDPNSGEYDDLEPEAVLIPDADEHLYTRPGVVADALAADPRLTMRGASYAGPSGRSAGGQVVVPQVLSWHIDGTRVASRHDVATGGSGLGDAEGRIWRGSPLGQELHALAEKIITDSGLRP